MTESFNKSIFFRIIINLVHAYNAGKATEKSKYKCAYTFDAGPNAVLYCLEENIQEILAVMDYFFPSIFENELKKSEYFRNCKAPNHENYWELIKGMEKICGPRMQGKLRGFIMTSVGEGPKVLSEST